MQSSVKTDEPEGKGTNLVAVEQLRGKVLEDTLELQSEKLILVLDEKRESEPKDGLDPFGEDCSGQRRRRKISFDS